VIDATAFQGSLGNDGALVESQQPLIVITSNPNGTLQTDASGAVSPESQKDDTGRQKRRQKISCSDLTGCLFSGQHLDDRVGVPDPTRRAELHELRMK